MPFTVQVFPEQQIVHLVTTGEMSFETARAAMKQVAESLKEHERLGLGILVDVRASDYTPSTLEIRDFAGKHAEMTQTWTNPAAVLATEGVRFGMARMLCALIELNGGKCSAFIDESQARDWLAHEVEKMRRVT